MDLPLAATNLPTTLIAGYAALVATISLGWQIWNSSQAKRPQVTVMLDTWRTGQTHGQRSLEEARIRIRNREDYAIRVERLYFRFPWQYFGSSAVPALIDTGETSELPVEIPAREVMSFTLRPTRDYRFPRPNTTGREFTPLVSIELRTGERYTSRLAQRRT